MSDEWVDWPIDDLPAITSVGVPHRIIAENLTLLPIAVEVDATAAWYYHALCVRGVASGIAWRIIGEAYASPDPVGVLDAELALRELGGKTTHSHSR